MPPSLLNQPKRSFETAPFFTFSKTGSLQQKSRPEVHNLRRARARVLAVKPLGVGSAPELRIRWEQNIRAAGAASRDLVVRSEIHNGCLGVTCNGAIARAGSQVDSDICHVLKGVPHDHALASARERGIDVDGVPGWSGLALFPDIPRS